MEKIKSKISLIIAIFIILITLVNVANADMGAKPAINIELKNMNTPHYIIDILVYDEEGTNYSSPLNYNGNDEQYSDSYNDLKTISVSQLETLHNINYDGWISESTRWNSYLLFADCSGNSSYKHCFSYFGVPERYKVLIINNDTGEIKVSNEIINENFESSVIIDVNTLNVVQKGLINIKKISIILISTVIIELIVALIMKLKNNIKIIAITNVLTNIFLQLILIFVPIGLYLLKFGIAEIIVIVSEYLVYKKYINTESNKKILVYTLIANIITAGLTFFI